MSTAGKSYEAWKESLKQAEAEGDDDWTEDLSEVSGPILKRQGAFDAQGMGALLASLALLLAGAVILLPKFRHLTQGERTVGVVVGYKNLGFGSGSSSIRAPVVRYSAPGGVADVAGFLPGDRSIYPLGKEVSVLYLRNAPGNAVIADFVQLFMIPTLVGGLGLVLLAGTTGFMYLTIRDELRAKSSIATRRQFAVADQPPAANDPARNEEAEEASTDDGGNDDGEHSHPHAEPHAVGHG